MVMAKKKGKKKAKKTTKAKKSKKKVVRRKKKAVHKAAPAKTMKTKEKMVGTVDHFFGHISVAAFKVKAPLKVGDMIHIKGHTTDFIQRVDSMQSNHNEIQMAKKGVEIGIKVKGKCRVGDTVFIAAKEQGLTAQVAKPMVLQTPMFPKMQPKAQPQRTATPPRPMIQPKPKPPGGYSEKKFFSF